MPTDVLYFLILVLTGLFLLFLEVAVIPGFGLVGLAGIISYGAGIALVWSHYGTLWGLLSIMVSVPVFVLAFWLFMKTELSQRLIQKEEIKGDSSSVPQMTHLLGTRGTAVTPLRPAGIALIEGKRYDVVTDGDFVEKGAWVTVSRLTTNSIVVTTEEP